MIQEMINRSQGFKLPKAGIKPFQKDGGVAVRSETRHPLFLTPRMLTMAAFSIVIALVVMQSPPAAAQGYEGLIPDNRPAANKPRNAPAATEQGYQGLISPARPERPRGYEGVLPGEMPERPPAFTAVPAPDRAATPTQTAAPGIVAPAVTADSTRPDKQRVAAMTPRPGAVPYRPIRTVEDLEALAQVHGLRLNLPKLDEEIAARIKIPPKVYNVVSSPRMRTDGMLPAEVMIKKQIDQVMFSINIPNITNEQRRRNARAGYERLMKFADSFTYKANLPDSLYEKMGAPTIFVQEQKEGTSKALMRLDEAFKVLKPLQ